MEVALAAVGVAILVAIVALRGRSAVRARTARDERTIHELEERLRAAHEDRGSMERVLSSMREGVLLVDLDGRTAFANPAIEELLGGRPATLDAVLPLGLRDAARRAMVERTPASAEVETGSPSRWLRGAATPVGDDGSVLLVVSDVTEARRLEAVRRDFVANASHELKTPAASIQAAAETIGTAAVDDPAVVPRFAAQLEREAVRLSRIVSDLLDLSRLESGSALDERVALDVVLRDEGERFEGSAAEAGVELSIRAGSVPRVDGSARDLALMVRNLVDNAIRYTRPGGRVDVRLDPDDGHVVLSVADTGVGIPGRDLSRIFERFYRVDRARSRETGGTGLGLSIVKHVAENHGGSVTVRSELGVGSTFVVRLPVAAAQPRDATGTTGDSDG
jgi:signal transduction histidine kinase